MARVGVEVDEVAMAAEEISTLAAVLRVVVLLFCCFACGYVLELVVCRVRYARVSCSRFRFVTKFTYASTETKFTYASTESKY